MLLIISKRCQSVGFSAAYSSGNALPTACERRSHVFLLRQQWLELESYDTQSEPSLGGGVAMETLPLSGLGSFVAVKAYY